jgi:hypothetical protein
VEILVSEVLANGMMGRIKRDFFQDFRPRVRSSPLSVGHIVIGQREEQVSPAVAFPRYSTALHIKIK